MWTLLEAKPASSRKRSSDALLMPSSTWRLAVVTWELPSMANCLGSTNDFIKAIDSKPNVLPRVPNTLLAPLNVWKLCVIYIEYIYIYIHYMYVFNDMFSISYMLWYAIYIYKILQASPWTHSILQIMWIVLWASKSRLVEWVPSLGTVVLCTLAKGGNWREGSNVWRTYFVTWASRCLYIVCMIFRIWHQHFKA